MEANLNNNRLEGLFGAICAEALPYMLVYSYRPDVLLSINNETLAMLVDELEDILDIKPLTREQHAVICMMTKRAWVDALQQLLSDGSLLNSDVQHSLFPLLCTPFHAHTAAQIMALMTPVNDEDEADQKE